MAANKFATMLHRNTNKITLVLVYAILEWILIILLLLNSLFSYLIIKFADYFGLKRPCIWCTRLDHILEPEKKNSYRDLVCEAHATEISKLGFCLNHQKLAESQDMCEDCSSSSQPDYMKLSQGFGIFSSLKQITMIDDSGDEEIGKGEETLRCSCCGVNFDSRFYPPCILIKPSLGVLDYTQKQNLIADVGVDAEVDEADHSDHSRSDFTPGHHEDGKSTEEENREAHLVSDVDEDSGRRRDDADESCDCSVCDETQKLDLGAEKEQEPIKDENLIVLENDQPCEETPIEAACNGQKTLRIPPQHLEFFIYGDDCSLIPVELVESPPREYQNQLKYEVDEQGHSGNEDVILDFDMHADAESEPVTENWHTSGEAEANFSGHDSAEASKETGVEIESMDSKVKESSKVSPAEEKHWELNCQQVNASQATQVPATGDNAEELNEEKRVQESCSEVYPACVEAMQMQNNEFDADVSTGTEIPDHEPVDEYQSQDILSDSNQRMEKEPSTSLVNFLVQDDRGCDNAEEECVEFRTMPIETKLPKVNNHLTLELYEIEEEKVPDTPTSVENLHQLHKKILLLERKESGTEESLDGSVMSDVESGEITTDKLKSALKAERKALNTLYAELEEERSASAVAANQTMAMINRLQEEKAAMQMEALQYQRMMEEQSEYDQEALQLLNELMIKREKEKQELEKELEMCRKKVLEYENREKLVLSRRDGSIRSRTSSASCSNAEDSDGLSVDLNHEAREENGFYGHQEAGNQNTPADAVQYLEESLASFEEERLSILEQLKVLEEKLVLLNYEEDQHLDFIESTEHVCEENGNGYHDQNEHKGQVNGYANGHSKEINGKHHRGRKLIGAKAKRLLPLFDAIGAEIEDGVLSGDENGLDFTPLQNSSPEIGELEKKKLALEEEVDNVYERLQALEADREFLKHCTSSLKKGDKGIDLLQEILQHLRDLRSVELRVKNINDLAV
ncbi:hypothetical protein L6164_026709 [Bauhinia variegata]|uniref:Uncharacterized protein n=1 Tax=Bauhinia variegata TaxID=167791 RepID=A0ACB9LRC8_BAUVA|nr:hypothetical protein L6164_026709 [Bauhinia variegata]